MRIALWDIDPFSHASKGFSDRGWDVQLVSPAQSGPQLLAGNFDVALVPSIDVLSDPTAFSVLPGVAFASKGSFPYLALNLHAPILDVGTVHCTPDAEPFYPLVTLVLREQYERSPSVVRDPGADARIVFGDPVVAADASRKIDVGLEWFEMTGAPLAWGFFAVRPGTPVNRSTSEIQEMLLALLTPNDALSDKEDVHCRFIRDSLCLNYDPEVTDGIDELAHLLFYIGILDDIPALRLLAPASDTPSA